MNRLNDLHAPTTRQRGRSIAMDSVELLSAKIYGNQARPHSPFRNETEQPPSSYSRPTSPSGLAKEGKPFVLDHEQNEKFGLLFDFLDDGSGEIDPDDVTDFFAGFHRPIPRAVMEMSIRVVCTSPDVVQKHEFAHLIMDIKKRMARWESIKWDVEVLRESVYRAGMVSVDRALFVFKDHMRDNFRQSDWDAFLKSRDDENVEYVKFEDLARVLLELL